MRVGTICAVSQILGSIKINKVADKATKRAMVETYNNAVKVRKVAKEEEDEIVRKFQDDWKDELPEVDALRKGGLPVTGHDAYLDAEADANKVIDEVYEREEDFTFTKFRTEELKDNPDLWPDDIVLAQITGTIDYLKQVGVAE